MSARDKFERAAQKVRDELRGEGEWEGHPASERGEGNVRYLEGYLAAVEGCARELAGAAMPLRACGACREWMPALYEDGVGLCRRMLGPVSSRVMRGRDLVMASEVFRMGARWALDNLRADDDTCQRFEMKEER